MTRPPIRFHGMPYLPGIARGRLRFGPDGAAPGEVLVVLQAGLDRIRTRPAGLVVVDGAPLSHTLIGVRALGVPMILVSGRQARMLESGLGVTLDGASGLLTSEGDAGGLRTGRLPPVPVPGQPVLAVDGTQIQIRASVRGAAGAAQALAQGASAIGLVRSEFLLPGTQDRPDFDFFLGALSELCEAAHPLSVTVRLLDIASDKRPRWLPALEATDATLGRQGVRLFGAEPVRGVVRDQIAALARLAERRALRLIVPYLTRLEELAYWRAGLLAPVVDRLPVGAMLETPAAVLDLRNWLRASDFVAVGCNDLMQCLFAADRDQPVLRPYLDPYAPVLFRLLRQSAVQAGGEIGRVQLCGLLPQLPGVLPVLLGLGFRSFAVEPALIPYLARTARETDMTSAKALAEEVCAAASTEEVLHLLDLASASGEAVTPFLVDDGAMR